VNSRMLKVCRVRTGMLRTRARRGPAASSAEIDYRDENGPDRPAQDPSHVGPPPMRSY
jgi:hypothetical protein